MTTIKYRTLSALLVLLVMFCSIAFAENNPVILDEADLLTEAEEAELLQDMQPVCDYGIPIFWTTTNEGNYMDMARQCFLNLVSEDESGIMFAINMNARQLTVYSNTPIYKVISEKVASDITGNVYRLAARGNYYTCASSVFNQIIGNLERNKNSAVIRPAKIKDMRWEHIVRVESKQKVTESGWVLPEGATLIEQRKGIHHYEQEFSHNEMKEVERTDQVVDHYETYYTYGDNGEGKFEETAHERPVYTTETYTEIVETPVYISIPVYQEQYYYEIERWIPVRAERTEGTDSALAWPKPELAENEREGLKSAFYYVTFTFDDQEQTFLVEEEDWLNLKVGSDVFINETDLCITDEKGNKLIQMTKK